METLILAIHSFPGANATFKRHWPFFVCSGADETVTIGTTGGGTEGRSVFEIGENKYIDGHHLPTRLVDTFALLDDEFGNYDWFGVCEYDTVFFKPICVDGIKTLAASHYAGCFNKPFYHNPWLLHSSIAPAFIDEGRKLLKSPGFADYGSLESSPDVFFGVVMDKINEKVDDGAWREFSRNSLDCAGDLDNARAAYRAGVDVIHGIKTEKELEYIINDDA